MKIVLFTLFASMSLFATTAIELSGKYSQELGNPFRVLLEKKEKSINIFSEDKKVKLEVESNLDNNSIYNIHLKHNKSYLLDNKSIENVLKNYYGEEYNIINKKGNIEVNVLSGKVFLTYSDDGNSQISHINAVEVELNIELVKNGLKTLKTIKLDNSLGKEGSNYSLSLTSEDFKNIKLTILDELIENIIDIMIFKAVKDNNNGK